MREPASSRIPVVVRFGHRPAHTSRLVALVAGAASIGALALPAMVHADNQDTIDYREHIMKTMADQLGAIQLIVENKAPAEAASNFATHVQILALAAATAKSAFKDNVAGGEAKPNVWTDWADFAKRMDQLAAGTADLAKTAESGPAATAPKLQAALNCKGCHDQYREEKKKK